ncbi:MAG: RHS repeat protein [Burkholderiales bacterium]|nr:RHS repeat protein [Burkholderiales bacterium]
MHRFCLKHGLVRLLAIVLAAQSIFIQLFARRPQRALLLLAFVLCAHASHPAFAADVQYVYDKLGRLVNVVAADGSSVQYTYDAVGNIQGIKKMPLLLSLLPNSHPPAVVLAQQSPSLAVALIL